MPRIDASLNTERENYKLLTGTILPRPIAFVTTRNENGSINGAPFSYFNVVSADPPLISLAVQRRQGTPKDTARNILREKEFVVHGVDGENVVEINRTAASLPPEESELEGSALTLVESTAVRTPGIRETKVRMECLLVDAHHYGDGDSGVDLLIGRVLVYHIDDRIYDAGRIDPHALGAWSRLAGISYASIGEITEMERPD